jgi:hypothetical protein
MVTMVLATSTFAQTAIVVESLAMDPQVAKTLWLIEHGSWALIGPPQIAFILGVSVVAIVERYPARWYGYSGVVVALGLVANMMWGLGGLAGLGLLWVRSGNPARRPACPHHLIAQIAEPVRVPSS